MTALQSEPLHRFISPRYWPTWLGISVLALLSWLPWSARMLSGRFIGLTLYRFGHNRRYITETNIRLCFPELDREEQRQLVRQSFIENGIGLIETATGWLRSHDHFRRLVTFRNLDVLEAARSQGRGVLLVGAHYSTLDLASNLFTQVAPLAVTYRPHKNRLFDALMMRGRRSNCQVIDRRDIRGAFGHLRSGGILWYAPDQDYGPRHAVYAPFFGQNAATITATMRFARHNDSPVVLIHHHRLPGRKGYEMGFTAFPEDFPCGDEVTDATQVNRMLESAIRRYPAQYLWMHKRFKTQPGGKPESPYIESATWVRHLRREDIEALTPLPMNNDGTQEYRMPEGHRLKRFAGLARRPFRHRHPAWRFDRMAKALRTAGIDSLTPAVLFLCRDLRATLVSYHPPPGEPLTRCLQAGEHPWEILGRFFADLHGHGFRLDAFRPEQLYLHDSRILLANPHEVTRLPMSLSAADRYEGLRAVLDHAFMAGHMERADFDTLYGAYRRQLTDDDRRRLDEHLQRAGLYPASGVRETQDARLR